ncbi:MAG: protein phosphatase CheZ [Holosporales bacterium]
MAMPISSKIVEQIKALDLKQPITHEELEQIVQSAIHSQASGQPAEDIGLYKELSMLAEFIRHARSEIAALQPESDGDGQNFATVRDELDAVIGATEEATGAILSAAESIEAIANEVGGEISDRLTDCVTRIYEASNFQDITGQRITKVIKSYKQVEGRINTLLDVFGPFVTEEDRPKTPEKTDEEKLLNGPALPAEAINQDDIDALFSK